MVGAVPAGLPSPAAAATSSDLPHLLLPALGVLLVGYTDNMLTARAFAAARRTTDVDANQELLALGAANLGAGLLHGFPVSSSGSRTALGRRRRRPHPGCTRWSPARWCSPCCCSCGPLLAHVPDRRARRLVVYAAVRLIDLAGFRRLAAFRRSELLLALGRLVGVLALDILYGVLVAVGLSVVELLRRVARPHDAILGLVPGLAGMHDVDDYPQARTIPGLVVYRYDSPLFFANAEDFRRRALAAVDEQPRPGRAGSSSTPRPTSRSTSPPWTLSRRCAANWPAAASCSRWPGSSRICATTSTRTG